MTNPSLVLPIHSSKLFRTLFLDRVARIIKEEIKANGCVPFEFNTIGVDDGIAMGYYGMLFSLPSRELIANSIETVMNAHKLDAIIAIPNCDKIVPGMIMGALRVDVQPFS